MRFKGLATVIMSIAVLCDVTSCSLVISTNLRDFTSQNPVILSAVY
jgi:hypothetical protein